MKKIILFIAIIIASYTQAQNILIVDNNINVDTSPSHMFSSFSAANAAAANGDIIYVQPSTTSYSSISITKEVSVYGMGHSPELNNERRALFVNISISASNVKLSGIEASGNLSTSGNRSNLTIENNKLANVYLTTGITNATVQGNIITNILALSPTASNSVNITINNNFFDSVSVNGLQYFNSSTIFNNNIVTFTGVTTQSFFFVPSDLVAQNNIFVSTGTFNGTNWQSSGTPTLFNNCLSYSYSGVSLGTLNGTGNFDNTNPVFASIPGTNPAFDIANDYNIGSGSLGTDGNDIGIYNGFYDFDMRGYPTLLPYIIEMTITNNMISAGETLQVNLKANANKTN